MYKSKEKVRLEIEKHEDIIEQCDLIIKHCDYNIARAKTTFEKTEYSLKRDRQQRKRRFSELMIKDLENHSNMPFYFSVVAIVVVLILKNLQ